MTATLPITQTHSMLKQLSYENALHVCQKYHLPIISTAFVRTPTELKHSLQKYPFPIALKAIGKKIIHKSDIGGVKLHIASKNEALHAFHSLQKIHGIEKVAVQPMVKGIEIIIGGKRDMQFGPVVLIGSGGIYTEILKDVSMRLCPVTKKDAMEMICELKIYPILMGSRGQKKINVNRLAQLLVNVSHLMRNEKISELDLNPVMATPQKIVVVDVRIIE